MSEKDYEKVYSGPVEIFRNPLSGAVVVLGTPGDDGTEDSEMNNPNKHNCDFQGCGQDHVIMRLKDEHYVEVLCKKNICSSGLDDTLGICAGCCDNVVEGEKTNV